jgi:hypothetical protein
MMRTVLAVVLALLPSVVCAAPVPPCDGVPSPAFGELDGAPQSGVWTADELRAAHWQPAACLGWAGETKLVAAVASRFHSNDDVFQRLGAISAWPTVKYWSVSHQGWRPLVLSAAMTGGGPGTLTAGTDTTFVQRDENSGETTYRLRVLQRSADRIVISSENVTPIKIAFVTAFEPGALQTVSFVEKDANGDWRTYQIARVGAGGSSLALGHKGSFLNRLEAVRRYLAGQVTDQHPPLASR